MVLTAFANFDSVREHCQRRKKHLQLSLFLLAFGISNLVYCSQNGLDRLYQAGIGMEFTSMYAVYDYYYGSGCYSNALPSYFNDNPLDHPDC